LSVADSLRTVGELRVLIDLPSSIPGTATSGAALLMLPIANLPMEKVFILISLFYLVLHLTTVFPLFKLLRYFGLDGCLTFQVLSVYFLSFTVTMFKLWPINEGPSMFLVSWFLYFVFVRPKSFFYLFMAMLAPFFRAHIFVFEISLMIYGMFGSQKAVFKKGLVSLGVSLGVMAVFRSYFPFETRGIGQHLVDENPTSSLSASVSKAFTHMFIPETVTKTIFGANLELGAELIGAFLLLFACISFIKNLKSQENRDAQIFSSAVFVVSLISLCLSLTIIARFIAPVYLWMVLGLLTFTLRVKPNFGLALHQALLLGNVIILGAFLFTKSTDPDFKALETVRRLAPSAQQGYSVVYFDESIPLNNRQLYGFFRKPAVPLAKSKFVGSFAVLLSVENLELKKNLEKLSKCQKQWFKEDNIVLANVQCPLQIF